MKHTALAFTVWVLGWGTILLVVLQYVKGGD